MDYRCPLCGHDLGRRKITQAVVTRMEIDCANCNGRIRLNVHRAEMVLVVSNFAVFLLLAGLAYWLQSQPLMLAAFAVAMAGAVALPLLERVYLRSWPRYAAISRS
jgi:hypothetical protein